MSNRITAMDIESQEFNRKMRGYDTQEVRLYLQSVAEEVERLNLEHGRMREEVGQLRTELEQLRSRDRTLQETLVSAQRVTEEIKDRARAEGELMVKDARLRADEIVRQARVQLAQLEGDIGRTRAEREQLEQSLRGVIEQHQSLLEMRRQSRTEPDNLRVMPGRVDSEVG